MSAGFVAWDALTLEERKNLMTLEKLDPIDFEPVVFVFADGNALPAAHVQIGNKHMLLIEGDCRRFIHNMLQTINNACSEVNLKEPRAPLRSVPVEIPK